MAWNKGLARAEKISGRNMDYEIMWNWGNQNQGFIQKDGK